MLTSRRRCQRFWSITAGSDYIVFLNEHRLYRDSRDYVIHAADGIRLAANEFCELEAYTGERLL